MNYSILLLLLFSLISLVFFLVDIYYWFIDRFSRYHIGRWKNENEWINKLYKTSISWLPIIPSIPTTSNKRLILWDKIIGTYKRRSVQSWQTAGLLIGINNYAINDSKKIVKKTIDYYIDESGMWKKKPDHASFAKLAYAILKTTDNKQAVKPSMDYMLELIKRNVGSDGMIAYSLNRIDFRYVDTLGLVCPFLALYSKTYKEKEVIDLAFYQIIEFNKHGLFKNEWLPVHAFNINNKLPLGVYGWGRGTGWYILSLIDVYKEMDNGSNKEQLESIIKKVADYLIKFQRDDGGFGVFLQNESSYDSSATAIFAYFYANVYELFSEEKYFIVLEQCINKLKSMTRLSGKLDYNQGDTVDIGIFSQRFDIMPFAQGMTLRAFTIYKKFI